MVILQNGDPKQKRRSIVAPALISNLIAES